MMIAKKDELGIFLEGTIRIIDGNNRFASEEFLFIEIKETNIYFHK